MSSARKIVVAALLALAVLSVAVAPSSNAQILPELPALPAPPAEGNVLADLLGPASATACDAVAVVYGLAGPIASAQLPPDLQALLVEVDPYLALITYACGFLAVPPSGVVCATDGQLGEQLGALGVPVALPTPTAILYETAAGLERALGRLGLAIGTDASRQLAEALGCGVPLPPEVPAAAALPELDLSTTSPELPSTSGFAGGGSGLPSIPPVVARPATPGGVTELPGTAGQLGALSYPVRADAAVLLALPLVLLAVGIAVEPRLQRNRRSRRRPRAPWTGAAS